jgi:hypothetical protein
MPEARTHQPTVATPLKARALFLDAVAKVQPQVLQTLRNGPYQQWLNVAPSPLPPEFDPRRANGNLTPFGKSLRRWSERWHLTEDWCLEWVLGTLGSWRDSDDSQPQNARRVAVARGASHRVDRVGAAPRTVPREAVGGRPIRPRRGPNGPHSRRVGDGRSVCIRYVLG